MSSWFVLLAAATSIAMTAPSARAQGVCGPIPASCPEGQCARGRAFGTHVALGGADITPLDTADTGCQDTRMLGNEDDFFDVTASGTVIPAAPLANVITSDSRTQADVRRQRYADSKANDAVVQLLPSATGGPAVLEVVSSGSEATVCGDSVRGTSHINALTVSGTPVPIPGEQPPNTAILPAPPLNLIILNEQICPDGSAPAGGCAACPTVNDANGCPTASCTVNALHVQVIEGGAILDLVVASSFAEVTSCPLPVRTRDFGAAYGGKPGDGALLPYFVVGPTPSDPNFQDALVAIVHDDGVPPPSDHAVHMRLFDLNSQDACDACFPWTGDDVFVESVYDFINSMCSTAGRNALDRGNGKVGDNVFEGYATFQPSGNGVCGTVDSPGEGDFVPYFYQVQLQQGLASGFSGPVFPIVPATKTPDYSVYNLWRNEPLYFRLLTGIGDPADTTKAETRLAIWSATSGSCHDVHGANIPDGNCLAGTAAGGDVLICDEAENCAAVGRPSFPNEVNVTLADDLVPAGFTTAGGWFSLLAKPTVRDAPLRVLGYSDNRAIGLGAARNFDAIFPAQRTRTGECF